MKKNKDMIFLSVALLAAIIIILIPKKKNKKEVDNSGFVGKSTADTFKSPYTKESNGEGESQLYRLSDYFRTPTRTVRDYTPVEILETRVLDYKKYFKINKDEWISEKDVRKIQR
jgi:hypothetical protein